MVFTAPSRLHTHDSSCMRYTFSTGHPVNSPAKGDYSPAVLPSEREEERRERIEDPLKHKLREAVENQEK